MKKKIRIKKRINSAKVSTSEYEEEYQDYEADLQHKSSNIRI